MAYSTFPNKEVAAKICGDLVSEGVIACANIFPPHTSIYKWDGRLQNESECAAILKTDVKKQAELKEKIRAAHPYENPCLVFFPVSDGLPEFLNWVSAQSRS